MTTYPTAGLQSSAVGCALLPTPGTGYTPNNSNTAITGYNDWGDSYTFGVAGYTWFDFPRTGGVIGSNNTGGYWGSLGYMDENSQLWGVYTPNNIYAGGLSRTTLMQVIGLTDTGTLRGGRGCHCGPCPDQR